MAALLLLLAYVLPATNLRDLAIAPFYGNSIASRLPAVLPEGHSSNGSSGAAGSSKGGSSGSCCGCGGSAGPLSAGGSSSGCDLLVLGDFRAAQRVCVQLRLSQPPPPPQQQHVQQQAPKQQQPLGSDLAAAAGNGSSADSAVFVWLVNTHLDHATPEIRARQMQVRCRALRACNRCTSQHVRSTPATALSAGGPDHPVFLLSLAAPLCCCLPGYLLRWCAAVPPGHL